MTDYTPPELRTHAEMLEAAKAISPEARVRVLDYGSQRWEIYIPTPFEPAFDLPDSYKGTPAWEAAQKVDYSHDNELCRWGHKNGYRDLPIEGVADFYNLRSNYGARKEEIAEESDRKAGFIPMSQITDWKPITEPIARQYMSHRDAAAKELAEEWSQNERDLNVKWGRNWETDWI